MKSLPIAILFVMATSVFAETPANTFPEPESPMAVVKSSLDGSMFEIIGRADSDNIIIHLNKKTGETKFLYNDSSIRIIRQESPKDVVKSGKINYQIVMSSNTVYLINTNTGVTWFLKRTGFSHSNDKFVLLEEK